MSVALALWAGVASAQPPAGARPLALEEALAAALARNPQIAAAAATVARGQAGLRGAKSSYYPYVSGRASQSHDESTVTADVLGTESEISTDADRTLLGLSLSQNIYDFGRREALVDSARAGLEGARITAADTARQIASQVAQAYYVWLQAVHFRAVRAEGLDLARRHVEAAEIRFEVGQVSPLEVARARAEAASSEVELLAAGNLVDRTRINLLQLMGEPDDLAVEPIEIPDPPLPELTLDQALQLAMSRRADLQAAEADLAARRAQLDLARTDYWPSITGSGGATWSGDEAPLDRSWSVSLGLSGTLFDGFATSAGVQSARADLRLAEVSIERLRLAARAEVSLAMQSMAEAARRREAAEVALGFARASLDLAAGRFEAGLASELELEDARNAYIQSQDSLYQARTDLRVARASLLLAIGASMPDSLLPEASQGA